MKNLYVLFLVLLGANGFSQTLTPEFEFQLYFEDAVGSRDTITLGYDPLATDSIDAQFGEINILDEAWGDNILEVRVTNKMPSILGNSWSEAFSTKKQILKGHCNNDTWFYGGYIYFDIKNASFPVRISFQDTIFQNQCLIGTLFNDYEPDAAWDIGIYGTPLKYMNGMDINQTLSEAGS